MATVKVIFRCSASASEGALFYRVIHARRMRQVHTGLRVGRGDWDGEKGEMLASNKECLKVIHSKLKEGVSRIKLVIAALDKAGADYTVDDVVRRFLTPETVVGFVSYAQMLIADLTKIGKARMADHYTAALNRFVRFYGEGEVSFADFNSSLVERFECHLKEEGICLNSISYYMRNLRAIYNKAVEADLTESLNPFKRVYTGIAKTVKRAVDIDVVKALRDMDLSGDSLSELARDLFLFSFYTRGMAIIDVAYLSKGNLKNDILTYCRQKTGRQLNIKWEPQMRQIADRYASDASDFLFPVIESDKPDYFKQYRLTYNKLLRRLKKIGKALGLAEPLTFHRSRHSWASIAMSHNVPLSVICEGMGHDSEKTTRIYLASLDAAVVDKANSDIIGLLDK